MSLRNNITEEYYHVYNRGVDKRAIFFDETDYWRFWKSLKIFNDLDYRGTESFYRRQKRNHEPSNTFVDILAACLMPNHFHILLKQNVDGGISEFMKKIGLSHTHFYNRKQGRSGRLFESPYQAKRIDSDGYLLHISRYIHLNALSLIEMDWKNIGISNNRKRESLDFLTTYPWSSFPDYSKIRNSNIIQPSKILELFDDFEDYKKYMFSSQPNSD
jgi:putative transposase